MKKKLLTIAIFLAVSSAAAHSEVYLWPLHGTRRLSSSFGEYRKGHYHAGIDIRTQGRLALPCLAIGDGYISRVKIAPTGYGKALYLKLSDGITAVYAHVRGFDRTIDSLAYNHRLERGNSWCDILLPAGRYRVSVGDTVCYTGQTGTHAPHLHFELRDEQERPFNPLERLYTLPDTDAPVISGLEAVPLARGSLVNGSPHRATFLFRAAGDARYIFEDTLQMDGAFGLGVSIWDEQGFGRYYMAPLSIELRIDGEPTYRLANSTFSYAQSSQIILEYDIVGEGIAGRYLLLFRNSAISMPGREGSGLIRSTTGDAGGLHLEPGVHRGEIIAVDVSGNVSVASFSFAIHRYPVVDTARKLASSPEVVLGSHDPDGGALRERLFESLDGGRTWRTVGLELFGRFMKGFGGVDGDPVYRYTAVDDEGGGKNAYFATPQAVRGAVDVFCQCDPVIEDGALVLGLIPDRFLSEDPLVLRMGGAPADTGDVYRLGSHRFSVFFDPESLVDGVNVFRTTGMDYRGFALLSHTALRLAVLRAGTSYRWNLDSLTVTLETTSMRKPSVCLIRETAHAGPVPGSLTALSAPFELDFTADRLARPLRMRCAPGPDAGLFRLETDGEWACIGVPERQDGSVLVSEKGTYAFFRDAIPPHIRHVARGQSRAGSGFFRPAAYYAPVVERGSGIDPYSAKAFLNGREIVCEWDGFREHISIPVPSSVPEGAVTLRIEVSDRAGNSSVGEFGFVLK